MSVARFEKATDDLRQVLCERGTLGDHYRVQRRWIVQTGEVRDATKALPPADKSTWMMHPSMPLMWMPVRSEYRDLPTVTEADVAAEQRAAHQQSISQTT
jgi:hypothetical protein